MTPALDPAAPGCPVPPSPRLSRPPVPPAPPLQCFLASAGGIPSFHCILLIPKSERIPPKPTNPINLCIKPWGNAVGECASGDYIPPAQSPNGGMLFCPYKYILPAHFPKTLALGGHEVGGGGGGLFPRHDSPSVLFRLGLKSTAQRGGRSALRCPIGSDLRCPVSPGLKVYRSARGTLRPSLLYRLRP